MSIDKLNLRLIQAAAYVQRFPQLRVFHKPGKANIVLDALSRLPRKDSPTEDMPILEQLDTLFTEQIPVFHIVLLGLSDNFKRKLTAGYETDAHYKPIIEQVRANADKEDQSDLPYELDTDGLLYSVNHNSQKRLVIPKTLEQEVFAMAYDQANHYGLECTFERLNGLIMHRMRRNLKQYIDACPDCEANQTRRHKPYGDMQPIASPPIPFHTLTMDFVLALPITR